MRLVLTPRFVVERPFTQCGRRRKTKRRLCLLGGWFYRQATPNGVWKLAGIVVFPFDAFGSHPTLRRGTTIHAMRAPPENKKEIVSFGRLVL